MERKKERGGEQRRARAERKKLSKNEREILGI